MRVKKTTELKFRSADEPVKEFYFYLGLLSTKFAVLEYNLLLLLGRLIAYDLFLTNTILERNTLSQNIELLKKINKLKQFDEKRMTLLIERISGIRTVRNLFIHGLWDSLSKQENDLIIRCSEPKLVYEENYKGREWISVRNHKFRLSWERNGKMYAPPYYIIRIGL